MTKIREGIYSLIRRGQLHEGQGQCKKTRGTGLLYIDQNILEKNLAMAWIYYKTHTIQFRKAG